MTAQISDTFYFKRYTYDLIGIAGGDLASPEQFGMEPEMMSTACYRGFYASYRLTDEALYLTKLTLREKNNNYLPIGEVKPKIDKYEATYTGLKELVRFTGKIRLAKDFIDDLYIHMGFQKPTAYKTVLDITLKSGRVLDIVDRSKEIRQKQGDFKKRFESGDAIQSIEESFSLDMDLE